MLKSVAIEFGEKRYIEKIKNGLDWSDNSYTIEKNVKQNVTLVMVE